MRNRDLLFLFITLLFSLQVNAYLTSVKNNEYFLDSQSKCITSCGSENSPFRTFNEAINTIADRISAGIPSTPALIVNEGEYFGEDNKDIDIDIDIDIISQLGSKDTIIDCQNTGYGFKITGTSNVMIKGLTIQNCVAGFGGAVNSNNILTTLDDIVFVENSARQGSAIYSTAAITSINSCSFIKNKGEESTSAVYIKNGFARVDSPKFFINSNDVTCSNSSIITSEGAVFGSSCADGCQIVDHDRTSYCAKPKSNKQCNRDGRCDSPIENKENCPSDCTLAAQVCNHDSICDAPFETIHNCPSDCDSAQHRGWRLDFLESLAPKPQGLLFAPNSLKVEYLDFPHIIDFMGKYYPPVSGILKSSISVTSTTEYTFKLDLKNLAAIVLINGRVLFDNYFQANMASMVHERSIILSSRLPYTIEITFTAINDEQRDLSLYWKSDSKPEYSLVPSYYITKTEVTKCGDGVCNETPESCLVDCYDQIEKECPAQSPPSNLQPFYGPVKDTLGQLINNQYIFSLPGVNYLSHGIDLQTGETLPSPVFAHTYCDNSSFSVVHAPHRGLVYSIPPGLHAQISPKCTMDTSTKSYSTSSLMAQEMSEAKTFSASLSGSSGGFFFKISISASLSMSESVKKASEMEKKTSGTIYHTELQCETSKVHVLEPFRFHPKFIRDVASAYDTDYSKAKTKMQHVIKTYGSMYYKSATLGGKLEQVSIVSSEYERSKTSQEVEKSMDMSFSVSASSKILPIRASASMSKSTDSKTSQEQQKEYETNSKRSTLIVSGGQPGSYGQEDFNSLHTWARTVDMIPFPIDYSAGFISDIIPSDWVLSNGLSARKLWRDAEIDLYRSYYIKQQAQLGQQETFIDSYTLNTLTEADTVYSFKRQECNVDGPIEITYFDAKGVLQTLSIEKNKFSFSLFIANHKDMYGIQTLLFKQGQSSCDQLELYNLFSARKYIMKKVDSVTGLFEIIKQPANSITIEIIEPEEIENTFLEVTIVGSQGLLTNTMKASSPFTIVSNGWIGDIKEIVLSYGLWPLSSTSFPTYPSEFSIPPFTSRAFSCKQVKIYQTCPQGESRCLPKNTPLKYSQSYTKIFASRIKTFSFTALTYGQASLHIPMYPLGH